MAEKRHFTEEQIAFVRVGIEELPTRKLAERFSEVFGEPLGQTELRRMMKRYGIQNPRKENKQLPIGAEKYSPYYDCIMVKVSDASVSGVKDNKEKGRIRNSLWRMKQNVVWEQTTGKKLGWREVVMFLDKDRMNYSPENLYAVPINIAGTVAKMGWDQQDPQFNKTALMWGELFYAMKGSSKLLEMQKSGLM